jgi:antitoxin HigA-1
MASYPAEMGSRKPTHPGELMSEVLGELELSTSVAAENMGVTRQALHRTLKGLGALTEDMALRFGALTGVNAEMLLQMQHARSMWIAKRMVSRELTRIAVRGSSLVAA